MKGIFFRGSNSPKQVGVFNVRYSGSLKSMYPEIIDANGKQITGTEYDELLNDYLLRRYIQKVMENYPEFGSYWDSCCTGRKHSVSATKKIMIDQQQKKYEKSLKHITILYKCTCFNNMVELTLNTNNTSDEEETRVIAWKEQVPYRLIFTANKLSSSSDLPIVGHTYEVRFLEMPCGARTPMVSYILTEI